MQEFTVLLKKARLFLCSECSECSPVFSAPTVPPSTICVLCRTQKRRNLFQLQNNMHPGCPPSHLAKLSALEESLISLHCPVLKIYRLKGGNFGYSGNCVAVTQDIGLFVSKLPRNLINTQLSIAMPFYADSSDEAPKSLRVSSLKIRSWLSFLVVNNPLYSDITIDEETLATLPECGDTFQHLVPFIFISSEDENENTSDIVNVQGVQGDIGGSSEEQALLNMVWPDRSVEAIKEFCMPNLLAKCFPSIFPFGIGDPTSPSRNFKVSLSEGLVHLTKYAYFSELEGRMVWPFGEHPIAAFYAFDVKTRQILLGQSGIFLKNSAESFPSTLEDLRLQLQDPLLKSSLLKKIGRYAGNIPGTPGYWQSRKDELLSLCEQRPPDIWFTLSAADNFWWDIVSILPPGGKPAQFPHLVDFYVSMKMDAYVKSIWGNRAEWYWYRLEYQSRGTVHLHGCVRLKNCPDLHRLYSIALRGKLNPGSDALVDAGNAAETEICNVADSLCSAWNPNPPADACSETRAERGERQEPHPCSIYFDDENAESARVQQCLNEVQRHRHVESYCMRKGVCRFSYPMPLSDVTHFIWTPTATGLKGTLFYRRNDRWLNNYNSGFKTWNANLDVKVIYNMLCLHEYLCGYATKSESTSASVARTLALAVTNPNVDGMVDPVKSAIRSAFIKGHSGRNISSQETAHCNLSLPLVCQPMIEYIRLSLDATSGSRLLDLEYLDIGTLIVPNLFDCYRRRLSSENWIEEMKGWCDSDECKQISLQEFACNYFYCKAIGKLRERAVNSTIRIVIAHPKLRAKPDSALYPKYCLYQLLLHHPWHSDHGWGENLQSVATWESFAADHSLGEFDTALMNYVPDDANDVLLSQEDDQTEFENWARLMNEREQVLRFHNTTWAQMHEYDTNVATKLHVAKSEAVLLRVEDVNPAIMLDDHQQRIVTEFCERGGLCIMTGAGGYGKSQVNMAIKQKLGKLVAVTAMTGKAGSLINGCTLHSFAHLPIKPKHKCALSKGSLGPFQKSLEGVTHIIIDEFTMMSQETLFFLDMRLKEGKGCDLLFGGMHVLLVGDTAQLPPVTGLSLWARPSKSTAMETVGAALYTMFNVVYILKINYRQRSIAGRELASFLDGMRTGALSDANHAFITSRSREQVGEAAWMAAAANAVHLYPTNEKVEEENTAKLRSLSTDCNVPIAMIRAINSCSKAAKASKKLAGGLDNLICMGVGAKVMLTQNLWTTCGLVNGAMGTIMDICGSGDVVDAIIVNVPSYSGPSLCAPHPCTWIPIPRSSSIWYSNGISKERKQFPLTLAYAITIHKSQGSTFPAGTNLMIDIGIHHTQPTLAHITPSQCMLLAGARDLAAGLTYVAYSRHSVGANIWHPGYAKSRFDQNFSAPTFKLRMREENRLRLLERE